MRKFLVTSLIWLMFTLSAHATILFAGGEYSDFAPGFGFFGGGDTTGGSFRPAWARSNMYVVGGSTADPNSNRVPTPTFTNTANIWVHFQWYTEANGSTVSSGQQVFYLNASDGNPAIVIRGTGAANTLKISKRSVAGSFTDLATTLPFFSSSVLGQLDIQINYGTSGSINMYWNSNLIATFSGDDTTDGRTLLNQLFLASGTSGGAFTDCFSEIIIATTDTRAMNLFTLYPNASGNATQWNNSSGSTPCTSALGQNSRDDFNYTSNDSNYIYTSSNSQIEECAVYNTIPSGAYTVLGVIIGTRVLIGSTGPQHFDFLTRVAGTDYASADQSPNNTLNNISNYIQTVNPATSAPWTISDLTAVGFNIGLESKP